MADGNRYAKDWNAYSQLWDAQYGARYTHLGDEWIDDHTADRKREAFYFSAYVDRWISRDMTVLELGPGGGKWTVRIAPKVKRLIVLDVAEEMLKRTKTRCEEAGIVNVEYVLANGRDFQPLADESIDFFFSYDVFVHIAPEDTWPYVQEISRVLKPGGCGACHCAINSAPETWDFIEQTNDWYRGGQHTIGQYYYFSPEALRRMYERCGLRIGEQYQEGWHCVVIFEKPAASLVPRLEGLLKRLISREADDDQARAGIVDALQALPEQLAQSLGPLLAQAQEEKDFYQRLRYAAEIRRLWRGV